MISDATQMRRSKLLLTHANRASIASAEELVEAEADEQAIAASLVIAQKLSVERLQDLEAATKEEETISMTLSTNLIAKKGPAGLSLQTFQSQMQSSNRRKWRKGFPPS